MVLIVVSVSFGAVLVMGVALAIARLVCHDWEKRFVEEHERHCDESEASHLAIHRLQQINSGLRLENRQLRYGLRLQESQTAAAPSRN
jgi:hypothetical protein